MEPIDLSDTKNIESWYERFELYRLTNDKIKDENATAFYLTLIGKEAYNLLRDLMHPTKPSAKKPSELHDVLLNHLMPFNFELLERAKFHTIVRETSETINGFILRIQQQAAKCNFGAELTTAVRDRILAGINNADMQRKLLSEKDLTLDKAKTILVDTASVEKAVDDVSMLNISRNESQVLHTRHYSSKPPVRQPKNNFRDEKNTSKRSGVLGNCFSCGEKHPRSECKFRNSKCFQCNKVGHIAKVCKQAKKTHFVEEMTNDGSTDAQDQFVLHIEKDNSSHVQDYIVIGKTQLSVIIDTGSPVNILNSEYLKELPFTKLDKAFSVLKGISGSVVPTKGVVKLPVKYKSLTREIKFYVVDVGPNILGIDGIRQLKVNLSEILQICSVTATDDNLSSLIHKLDNTTGGMHIDPVHLDCNSEGKFYRARPLAYGIKEAVCSSLTDLCNQGILKPVENSTWATPIVTVLKKNGKVRICGDYRVTVNPFLKKVAATTADPEEIFSQLHGAAYFSKLDLTNAFLQIPLDADSQALTTIVTPAGLFQYNFLPFGLSVSPGIFQKVMNDILVGISGVVSYQDDILVFGKSLAEHDHCLRHVLQRLLEKNVRINKEKSSFRLSSIPYLGYRLSVHGISPDSERVKPVADCNAPKNHKELHSMLGLFQYYSRFVPNFATIATPLFDLLKSEKFEWTDTENSAFEKLKAIITSEPILKCFQFSQPVTVVVDASETGIGGVLEQSGRPVTFVSRKLNSAEILYSQTQKEALAIFWTVKRLHKYLFGKKFLLVSDHQALRHIFNPSNSLSKCTSAMLARWAMALGAYEYDIQYKAGKSIPQADFLSRYSSQEEATKDVYFLSPVPTNRNVLIEESKKAFGSLYTALKYGWTTTTKKRYPEIFAKREEMSLSPDGLILVKGVVLVPPACRKTFLEQLHSGHLGVDKMKSLARLYCFWPSMNSDIQHFNSNCRHCFFKSNNHPKWKPWPLSFEPMQRVHADYCGPFLDRYYALIVIDSFSKYPEVFLTQSASSEFTRKAFQKFFAREGIPHCVVSDNGTHFTAQKLQDWMKQIGSTFIFTAPRHPQSNGQAENFVKSLKSAVRSCQPSNCDELENCIDNFLLQYRNAVHSSTKHTPAKLFKGRNLRTSLNLDTTEVFFRRGNDLRLSKGLMLQSLGNKMMSIVDVSDGSVHRRHCDQIKVAEHGNSCASNSTHSDGEDSEQTLRADNLNNGSVSHFSPRVSATSSPKPLVQSGSSPGGVHQPSAKGAELSHSNDIVGPSISGDRPRASSRTRRPPRYLKDFVDGKEL